MKKTTPLEKDIEKAIGTYAKSKGCLYYKFTSPAMRAVPDRIIVTPTGVVGFLEVKREGAKPTPLQMAEINKLAWHGANVAWVDSAANGKAFIDRLLTL
jgi:hypothetical protein